MRIERQEPSGHSHHGQFGVRHYQKVLELAASKHMTINAHEPIKDTGYKLNEL